MLAGLTIILTLAACTGTAFLVLGSRGRRVNDHPICRGCRFDLIGVYPASRVCPECGIALVRDTVPLEGLRRRSRRLLLVGAVLVLVGGVPLAWGVLPAAGQQSLARFKPRSLLLWELEQGPINSATAALAELRRRVADGAASGILDDASDAVLARHAALERGWDPRFGDFLEARFAAGALTNQEFVAYVDSMPGWQVYHQPRVWQGSEMYLGMTTAIGIDDARAGSTGQYQVVASLISARIGSTTQVLAPFTREAHAAGMRMTLWPAGYMGSTYASAYPEQRISAINAEPGRAELVTEWAMEVEDTRASKIVASWTRVEHSELQVIPLGEPLTALLDSDPATERVLYERIRIGRATYRPPRAKWQYLDITCNVGGLPVDCAWRAEVIVGEHRLQSERRLGGFNTSRAAPGASDGLRSQYQFHLELPAEPSLDNYGTVTILLLPDPEGASIARLEGPIWGGELAFDSVPVVRESDD